MKCIGLAVILIFAFNLVDAKKQAEWFLAETTEDCENIPSELRSDNPVGLCEKADEEYCACVKRRKGFVFICGVCTFKFVVGDRNRVEFQSNETNDSPEIPRGPWMSSRWPRAIVPFELNTKNGRLKDDAVKVAIKKIERDTCIRFIPREEKHKKYLIVKSISDGGSCWTKNIGVPNSEKNVINIGDGCGTAKKILHELLHALGMYHTHQRWDRDKYVTIKKKEIQKGKKSAFRKISKAKFPDFGIEYDCSSIMHYQDYFFGKRKGAKTIIPKNSQTCENLGGKNAQLAESDIQWLNAFYECG